LDKTKAVIEEARKVIDELDDSILELLSKRAREVIKIGKAKSDKNMKVRVPSREEAIFKRLNKRNNGHLTPAAIRSIFSEIISQSIALEESPVVSYMGPKATFSHQACIKRFALSAQLTPVSSIEQVFRTVEDETAQYGVVPVENSTEGIVSHTLDMFTDFDVKICGEIYLEITLNILSHASSLKKIEKIYSHRQPIAQARQWLRKNIPNADIVEVVSTSRASELASEEPNSAAIASEMAAKLYNMPMLERKIEDNPNNLTRFLIIGKETCPKTDNDKSSIIFGTEDQTGALCRMLSPFAEEGVNLTKIESRPSKKKPWEYIFYLDMSGHITSPNVERAVEKLRKNTVFFSFLGSYHAETPINEHSKITL